MAGFTKSLPTSKIHVYKKQFDENSGGTPFNPAQSELGDSSESIKRYLESLEVVIPASRGKLFENVSYENPGTPLFLRHDLGRPYVGIDIVNLKAPEPFKLQLYKSATQTVTTGTTTTLTWVTTSSFDPFGALSSGTTITPPFNANCDFSITIDRTYSSGTVAAAVYDEFWLRNITLATNVGSRQRLYRQTASTGLLDNSATLVCLDKPFSSANTYDVRFECNAFNQTITSNADNVTQVYIVENKSANPRIDETLHLSGAGFDPSYQVPITSDKACTFSVVVY